MSIANSERAAQLLGSGTVSGIAVAFVMAALTKAAFVGAFMGNVVALMSDRTAWIVSCEVIASVISLADASSVPGEPLLLLVKKPLRLISAI